MAYDINVKRVSKALKIGRRYLSWAQNSLFEGELTKAQLAKLKSELKEVIKEDEDSVVFYLVRRPQYMERQVMGTEKGELGLIL